MSNLEGEQRDRALQNLADARESGDEARIAQSERELHDLEADSGEPQGQNAPEPSPAALDSSDSKVQNPSGLGPENPHAKREGDLGQAEVQERMDVATEKGYIGGTPDPTPDANYSLLTPPDASTPETDPDAQKELQDNIRGNRLVNTTLNTVQTQEGAEPIPKAEGTKTPAESQASQPQDLKKEVANS